MKYFQKHLGDPLYHKRQMQKRDKMFSNTHLLAIKNDVPVDTSLMTCKDQQCNEKNPDTITSRNTFKDQIYKNGAGAKHYRILQNTIHDLLQK